MDVEVVILGKILNEVLKIFEDVDDIVDIIFINNYILFNLEKIKIILRLLEGKFINYNLLLF